MLPTLPTVVKEVDEVRGRDTWCVELAKFHGVNILNMTTDFKLLMKVPECITTENYMSAIKSVPGACELMSVPCWSPLFTSAFAAKNHTFLCGGLGPAIQMV